VISPGGSTGHAARAIARPMAPAAWPSAATIGAVIACAVLAALLGVAVALEPLLAGAALATAGCLALAFLAPVAHLSLLLLLTAVVGFSLQSQLGGRVVPSDLLLLTGLVRAIVVLLRERLDARRLAIAGLGAAMSAAIVLQFVHGLRVGAGSSQAGAEMRELLGLAAVLIALPIVADRAARRRLMRALALLGLLLGLWGLAQWGLGVHVGDNVDIGVRGTQDFATSGSGQLHGGLYGYPVAVVMSAAALFAGRPRGPSSWLLGAVLATNVVCLVLTYERTFWVATVLGLAFVIAKIDRGRRLPVTVTVLVVAAALLGVLATLLPSDLIAIRDRALSLGRPSGDNSLRYRVTETRFVMAKIKAHPLTGSGLGDTIFWGRPWQQIPPTARWFAHNGYLWVVWKLGAVAAALLFLLLIWAVAARPPPGVDSDQRALQIAAQAGLLVLLLSCFTFPFFSSDAATAVAGVLVACCFPPRISGAAARG
jgi:hypothetical protein